MSRLVLLLMLLMLMLEMTTAAVQRSTGDNGHSITRRRVGNDAPAGNDAGENEPLAALLVAPLRRRQQWKRKPATPEGVSRRDSPQSSEETGATSNRAGNGNRPDAATGALPRRGRSRRDVYGVYRPRPGPRPTRSGPASAEAERLRRLYATSIDTMSSRRTKRPESHSETIERLSNVIRSLLDVRAGGGGGWSSCAIDGRDSPPDRRGSWIDDEIFIDKKASQRRRKANSGAELAADEPHRGAPNSRRHRPQIDPMLMMVGIGRK